MVVIASTLTIARRQLIHSITAAMPNIFSTPEIIWTMPSASTRLIFSTSLVSRLIRSPCGRWSKKRSGKLCSRPNRSLRMSRTVRWAAPAMT